MIKSHSPAVHPSQLYYLAFTVLGITCVSLSLGMGSSYAAYASFADGTLGATPDEIGNALVMRTRAYVFVSSTLAFGYGLAMIVAGVSFVRRTMGEPRCREIA